MKGASYEYQKICDNLNPNICRRHWLLGIIPEIENSLSKRFQYYPLRTDRRLAGLRYIFSEQKLRRTGRNHS